MGCKLDWLFRWRLKIKRRQRQAKQGPAGVAYALALHLLLVTLRHSLFMNIELLLKAPHRWLHQLYASNALPTAAATRTETVSMSTTAQLQQPVAAQAWSLTFTFPRPGPGPSGACLSFCIIEASICIMRASSRRLVLALPAWGAHGAAGLSWAMGASHSLRSSSSDHGERLGPVVRPREP